MRYRSALCASALACACVPERTGGAALEGETWVVLELVEGRDVDDARLYTRATRPTSLVHAHGAQRTLYVLSYDASPETLALSPEADGTLLLAPLDAAFNETWPLPAPDRWASLEGLEGEAIESTDAAVVLAAMERAQVRLPRPPCPEVEVEEVTLPPTIPRRMEISMVLPFGERGALIGSTVRYAHQEFLGPSISYVEPGAPTIGLGGPFAYDGGARQVIDPEGYVEDGEAWVVWGDRIEGGRAAPVLRSITSTLGIGPAERVLRANSDVPLRPSAMVVSGTGPSRLHLAMTSSATLERFDEEARVWRVVRTGPSALVACLPAYPTTILEIFEGQRGLVSFPAGPILSFDLSVDPPRFTPYAPELQDNYCKAARALFDAGDELIATKTGDITSGGTSGDVLWWRRTPSEAFRGVPMIEGVGVNGAAVATLGELAFASLKTLSPTAETLAIFDREPRRPDLPPRHCGNRALGFDVRQLVRIGDRVLAAGAGGHTAAWLSLGH